MTPEYVNDWKTTCRYYLGLLDEKDLKRAHERFLEW